MTLLRPAERLYLQRDNAQDILIDLPRPFPQHQIDGIRFLFKQFKKKAPGVILNDPSGYGKCVQVVLFLNAIRPILKKPVLVLSDDVNNWKEHFIKWANNCIDDLAIETSSPFSKKEIYINRIKDGAAFCRRAWGIVVAHDEDSSRELLKMNFNADYKIWVTFNNLKENLYTLASIYEWLHPNQKFNVEHFTAQKNNSRDVVEKALLLDAFLEDFLIRRTDIFMPFFKPQKHKPSLSSPVKSTRKNKDPTGTKVKRSKKRKIEDDDEANLNKNTVSNETIQSNDQEKEISGDLNVSNDDDNNMDVESFIRNEKPIETVEFDFIDNRKDIQTSENVSQSINIRDAVDEIVENEKITITDRSNDEDSQRTEAGSPLTVQGSDNNAQLNVEKTIKEDMIDEDKNRILFPKEEGCDSQSIFSNNENTENTTQNENDKEIKEGGVLIPETESENGKESYRTFENDNNSLDGDEESNDWKINDNIVTKNEELESKNGDNNSKSINGEFDKSGINNDNTNRSNEVMKKMSKIEEFDAELADMEAKALKKFKSSILDSLF